MDVNIFLDYCKRGNEDKLIQYVLSRKIGEEGGLPLDASSASSIFTSWDRYQLFKEVARILAERRLYDKLLSYCNECLNMEICFLEKELKIWMYYYMYIAYYHLRDNANARKYCMFVMQQAESGMESYPLFQDKGKDSISIKRKAKNDFQVCDDNYVKHYLELPYNERKMLLVVKNYTDLFQSHLSVIDVNKISNTGIEFPVGHPIVSQLYVGHPYVKQKYLKFEDYELELIEDKVREFCLLVQCLGATEVSIECLNSSSSDKDTKMKEQIGGEVGYKIVSVSGKYESNQSKRLLDEISQSISLHQKFIPQTKPYLPKNLYWYPNEASWQRLYSQRMQGGLLQHEERIETRKSRVFEGTELKSIEAELKTLLLSVNVQWNKKEEEKFELSENAILVIRVNFAPLNELSKLKSEAVLPLEKKDIHLENLASTLANNGQQMFKKIRNVLKTSSLSKMEKEYLEEYKLCLEDGGDISASEKRLLDKLRNRLGISEERAREIERIILK